jgi:hypothetical protein
MRGQALGDCARQLLQEVATVRSMDSSPTHRPLLFPSSSSVVLPVREAGASESRELRLRVVARPDRPVAELLHRLGLELPSAPKTVQNVVEKTGL